MVFKIDSLILVVCLLLVVINNAPELLNLTDSLTKLVWSIFALAYKLKNG